MPVALITAADGVYHPTLAALIIGRQGQRSIYPDCSHLKGQKLTRVIVITLAGLPTGQVSRLQSVLRAAARLVLGLPGFAPVSAAMHDTLHWWVGIISRTERRNGTTASGSGFYKNMIIYGTEWQNTVIVQP